MPLTQVSSRAIEDTLRYVLGASGTNHYTFTGKGLTGAVNDPTLTLSRGHTYIFENRSGGHPFYIKTSIANGGTNDAYNTGVTNNGGGNGTEIVFTVPHDAPDTLYYQCSSHSSMNGQLSISGSVADGSITTAKLAADAVDGTKIADDAINSEHFVDGSIDTAHIADDAVTADKLANSINTAIAANTAKDLTALSASNLTSGTVPDARFPATLPAISGANLTGIQGIPTGVIMLWSGASNAIPSGFVICDGNNSTPDLRDRFVVGAGNSYAVGATGGSNTATDTVSIGFGVSVSISGTTGNINSTSGGGPGWAQGNPSTSNGYHHNHTFSGSGSGSGSGSDTVSIDTRSPYYALCYIMKS